MAWRTLVACWTFISAVAAAPTAIAQTPDQDVHKRAATLRRTVTEMTDLEFKAVPKVGLYSKDELRAFLLKDLKLALPPREAKRWERIGAKFGFWGRDFNLFDTYVELLTDSIAGFYHPRLKELKIVRGKDEQDPQERMVEQMLGVKMADVYMLHELFHAAQDQHFDLMRYKAHNLKNDDLSMALETLIEGEATMVHYRFMLRDRYPLLKRQFMMMPPSPPKPNYPKYLFNTLYFPYSLGFRFVDEAVEAKGWKVASKMFADPPLSSEMVLHPEKWTGADRDYPQDVRLRFAKVSKALGKGWRRLEDNVHGEYVIRLMFEEFRMRAEGEKAAAGWDGDRYAVYHRASDDRLLSTWLTTWDSEADAKEFSDSYLKLLRRKYGGLEPAASQPGAQVYKTASDGLVLIEVRGSDVLVVEGADEADLQVRDAIWETLQKSDIREFVPKPVILC